MKQVCITLISLLLAIASALPTTAQSIAQCKYKKALVIGAHPDAPETIAGGTMLVLKSLGCEVVSIYLTGGEAGISGMDATEAAAIRHRESTEACQVMGIRPILS